MRIAIDARMMGPENTRGIGRYIEELVKAFLEIASEHRYVLVTRRADHRFASHPSVETVVADIPWYGVREQLEMPSVFEKIKPDVLHIPHWNVPVLYRGPYILTIHDLLLRHAPESTKASTRGSVARWIRHAGYRFVISHAVRHATKILVPSAFVARDVASFYPKAAGRVCVTGEGMPRVVARSSNLDSNFELLTSNSPYLLYVGAAYPHKGLQDVLTVWPRVSELYPQMHLKIAGEKDVFMHRYEANVEAQGLRNISFLDRVSEDELDRLYDGALAFIYPTHQEGFGLPPLEAISRGCPVLSSDVGPLPEVLGKDGAIFFQAGDQNAILAAVQELVRDPAQARLDAARLGPTLAARHDWKQAAACTLGAYGDPYFHCPACPEG